MQTLNILFSEHMAIHSTWTLTIEKKKHIQIHINYPKLPIFYKKLRHAK